MKIEAKGGEDIDIYLHRLVAAATERCGIVEGEFNGTPVTARPGEGVDDVFGRWWLDRIDHQRESFMSEVCALRTTISGRVIISVNGRFKLERGDGDGDILIQLDDGTVLVAGRMRVSSSPAFPLEPKGAAS